MNNRKYKLIIFILIIIIFIALFFVKFEFIKNSNDLIPTGNVNVFDIDVNCICENEKCTLTDKDGNIIPVYKNSDEVIGNVYVDDLNGNYMYLQKLDIFTNSAYNNTNMIAPGVSNVYHFVVHNSTNSLVSYKLSMTEKTEYKINMVYRLKKNNEYVIGNDSKWVSANELNTKFQKIEDGNSDNYSLEWKWLYDKNDDVDTFAGKNMKDKYNLNIKIYFEAGNN